MLLVTLFVLTTLIKTILLFVNEGRFDSYRKKTKVIEMVITMIFLVTGLVMIGMRSAGFNNAIWIKLIIVFASIPLLIVGYKKKNKILALVGTAAFIISFGLAERSKRLYKEVHFEPTIANYGGEMYNANCATCHGETGASGLDGAADLSKGEYEVFQVRDVILNGSSAGKMKPFSTLDSTEASAIAEYVMTLK